MALFKHRSRLAALTTALALVGAPAVVSAAPHGHATLSIAPAAKAVVDVKVDLDQPDDEAVAGRIRGDLVKALNAEGIAVTKSADATTGTIAVTVSWNADDNHEIAVTVHTADGDRTPTGSPWICDTCQEAQILAMVAEATPAAIELLPTTASTTTGDPASTETPDNPDNPTDPGRKPLGKLGKAGIGLLVGGTASLVGGVVLVAVLGKRDERSGESVDTTDYRPGGAALIGVGAALVVTGAVLLGIDRKRAKSRTVSLAPSFGRHGGGLALTTHF
jgi:hypothetical protein